MSAHGSEKLPVTFELRESELCGSVERPAVVRVDGHCLEIYSNRIVYRGKTKYWKNIIECGCTEERCKTYAQVPLTRTKEVETCNHRISNFKKSDHIHFWITRPKAGIPVKKEFDTMGHFYVSSSGVAWVGKDCDSPVTKSWDDLKKWMAS